MKKILLMIVPALAVACNEAPQGTPAINLENFDASVSPAENFYQHVTGGWQKNHPLKPEYSRYGSFDVLNENNQKRINEMFLSLGQQSVMPGSARVASCLTFSLSALVWRVHVSSEASSVRSSAFTATLRSMEASSFSICSLPSVWAAGTVPSVGLPT